MEPEWEVHRPHVSRAVAEDDRCAESRSKRGQGTVLWNLAGGSSHCQETLGFSQMGVLRVSLSPVYLSICYQMQWHVFPETLWHKVLICTFSEHFRMWLYSFKIWYSIQFILIQQVFVKILGCWDYICEEDSCGICSTTLYWKFLLCSSGAFKTFLHLNHWLAWN